MKSILNFLFKNQNIRQTVAKNTFWLSFGEIAGRVIRAAIIIYAARVLGAAGWGAFSYAISLAGFFTIFSDFGVSSILTREAAKNDTFRLKYLSTIFFIKLILAGISLTLIIFAAPYFTKIEEAKYLLPIIAFVMTFDTLRNMAIAFNNALEKMEVNAVINISTNIAIVGLGIAFLLISPKSSYLAVGYALGTGVGLAIAAGTLRKYFKDIFSRFSRELIVPILKSAWPFTLLGLLGIIMINTDTIMLGWMRSAAEVGFYSAAQRPIQFLYALPAVLATSIFPNLARWAKSNDKKFGFLLGRSMILVFAAAFPLCLGGIILGPEIIYLLYGAPYYASILAFQILMLTLLAAFPSTLIGNAIFAYDRQKSFIGFIGLGALSNVLLNFFLIPWFGIYGSAAATIFAQLLAIGFIWAKMKKINYFEVFPHLKKIIFTTAIMVFFVLLLKYLGVIFYLNIIFSALIYFLILYLLKEPILTEIKKTFRPEPGVYPHTNSK